MIYWLNKSVYGFADSPPVYMVMLGDALVKSAINAYTKAVKSPYETESAQALKKLVVLASIENHCNQNVYK